MKKLVLSLLAALSIVGLASCNNESKVTDETAPVINGVKDLNCSVNETVNLLTGVTAVDETDGDITEKIEISIMPTLTVTNGQTTPTQTGDYEVAYKVKDAAGNEQSAFATLNVAPALAEKLEYKKYEFKAADTQGWGLFLWNDVADSNVGTVDIVKGNLQVNITKNDKEAWHVKFENNIPTTPGVDYKVTYNFVSSVAGIIKTNDWTKEVEVVAGNNTCSYSFTAGGEEKSYLCLELGMLEGPFTLDFTSIEVQSSVGEDVYTNVTPEGFAFDAEGVVYSGFDNNSTGSHATTATSATLDITRGSDENGCWQSKLFIKPGFDLEAGKKYKISVDVESTNGHNFEICYNNGDAEKGIGALYGLSLEAGEKKTFEIIVKHDTAKDNLVILLQLGTLRTPQGADTVTVSNLKIEEIGGNKTVETDTLVFTPEGFGTYNDAASAAGMLYTENGKLVYEMSKIGLTDWHNKMYVDRIELESDKIYTISFKAKADKNISCALFLNVCGSWDPRLSATVDFTTTEQTFEFTVPNAFAADMAFEILWQFGSEANSQLGGAKIEFSEIIIYSQDVQ